MENGDVFENQWADCKDISGCFNGEESGEESDEESEEKGGQ